MSKKLITIIAIVIGLVVGIVLGLAIAQSDGSVGGVNFEYEEFIEGFKSYKVSDFSAGITSTTGTFSGTATISGGDLFVGSASSTACLKLRDSDDEGYSYITILDGTVTATTTSCE